MKSLLITIAALCSVACTSVPLSCRQTPSPNPPNWSREMLVGRWADQHPNKYGGTTNEVATLHSDGTYILDIDRTNGAGLVERFSAFGEWGLAGDIYFTKEKGQIIDGEVVHAPPGYPDTEVAYKAISLTRNQFIHCDIEEDVTYHARRTGSDK